MNNVIQHSRVKPKLADTECSRRTHVEHAAMSKHSCATASAPHSSTDNGAGCHRKAVRSADDVRDRFLAVSMFQICWHR